MGIIWFNVPEAYKYLMEHGEVYTLRDHLKKEGKAMLKSSLEGKPYYKGMVIIKLISAKPSYPSLTYYKSFSGWIEYHVGKSGFKTVEEWLSKVDKEGELFLFHVRKM